MASTWQSDSQYLAALRRANMDEAEGSADVRTRQGRVRRNLGLALPEMARQGEFERQGISGGYESRGLFRSGMRQDAIARQRYDQARREALTRTAAYDELGDLETSLARLSARSFANRTDAAYGAQQREYGQQQDEALRSEAMSREDALAEEARQRQAALYAELFGRPVAGPQAPQAAALQGMTGNVNAVLGPPIRRYGWVA